MKALKLMKEEKNVKTVKTMKAEKNENVLTTGTKTRSKFKEVFLYGSEKEKQLKTIRTNWKLRDVIEGFEDNSANDNGSVTSMNGRLNIRPSFQRSYVVSNNKDWQTRLVNSVINGRPINLIYVRYNEKDDTYELIDGQQRIMTLCEFMKNRLSLYGYNGIEKAHNKLFGGLPENVKENMLDYELDVAIVKGDRDASLSLFKTINQEQCLLKPQELRNANFGGTFVESAKCYFSSQSAKSRPNNEINNKDSKYFYQKYILKAELCRQDVLEIALDWLTFYLAEDIREEKDSRIENYMSSHIDKNADELIEHYRKVIDWVNSVFNEENLSQKCARNVNWGEMYRLFHTKKYTKEELKYINDRILTLNSDEEVSAHSKVFKYVLLGEGDEYINLLNLRAYPNPMKKTMINLQRSIDPITGEKLDIDHCHAHHIKGWKYGGKTNWDNLIIINDETHKQIHNSGDYNAELVKQLRDKHLKDMGTYDEFRKKF